MTPQPVASDGPRPRVAAVAKVKWACWLGVLALTACEFSGEIRVERAATDTSVTREGRPVTGDGVYLTQHDLPRAFRHLVAMELTGPYYLAFSDPYACVLTSAQYTMLRRGEWLTCDWRPPR